MNNMKKLLLVIMGTLALTACGGGGGGGSSASTDGSGTTPISSPSDSLVSKIPSGIYNSIYNNCSQDSGGWHTVSFLIDQTNAEYIVMKTYFTDMVCGSGNERHYESMVYSYSSSNKFPDGTELVRLRLIDAQISVVDQNFLNDLNSNQVFGLTWVLGNAQSVIDLRPQPNQEIFYPTGLLTNISMKYESNSLLIGNSQYVKQ